MTTSQDSSGPPSPSGSQLPSGLQDHLGYWLRFVSNHVSQAFKRKVEASGVTVAEWVVLRSLLASGPVHPSQAADDLGLTRGAVSKLVERLVRKGLVQRTSSTDDRRFQQVCLTSAGSALTPGLARLADDNEHEFFGHLSAAQRASLTSTLQDLVRRHGWKDVPVD